MTAAQDELELIAEDSGRVKGALLIRLWRFLVALFVVLISLQLFAALSHATPETICPSGASPRADVVWCAGFDDLDQCTTGQEAGCVSDAGLTSLSVNNATKDFKIKTCPVASPLTTSTGCIYGSGEAGGTGPGYSNKTYTGVSSACLRYYVLFGDGWLQNVSNTGNHGPGLIYTDDSDCRGKFTIDFTLTEFRIAHQVDATASCTGTPPDGGDIPTTGTEWNPKNNQWYRVEMCSTMDTSVSSGSAGNGTLTVKIDGVTAINRTNLNIHGDTDAATWKDAYLARSFIGLGTPHWEPNIYFAGFAFSNNGTEIGASSDEASLASGDPSSPYWYNVAGDGAEERKLGLDCSVPSSVGKYVTSGWTEDWGTAGTFEATPDHNTYACQASCVGPGCTTTKSMQAQTTGADSRAGLARLMNNYNSTINNQHVIHSWVYLDSANDYTTAVPILGFARYCAGAGGGNDRCVVGIARNSSGKLVVVMWTDNTAGTTITSTADLPTDTWTELQFAIGDDNKVYAQINGVWVIDGSTPSQAIGTWAFDDASAGPSYGVHGIMRSSPATTYTVNYDDMDAGAISFNDSKFWGTSIPSGFETQAATATQSPFFLHHRRRRRN